MFKQRLALRSNKVKMKFCGAQLREMPSFEKHWLLCTIRGGGNLFLYIFFFNWQSTGPTEPENCFSLQIWQLNIFRSLFHCGASSVVMYERHNLLFSKPFSLEYQVFMQERLIGILLLTE